MQQKPYWRHMRAVALELRRLRDKIETDSISTPNLSGMPFQRSGSHSRTESAALDRIDAIYNYESVRWKYAGEIEQTRRIISNVKPERYRRLLTMRYVDGASWREITQALGYRHKNSVFNAHKWALIHADKYLTMSS